MPIAILHPTACVTRRSYIALQWRIFLVQPFDGVINEDCNKTTLPKECNKRDASCFLPRVFTLCDNLGLICALYKESDQPLCTNHSYPAPPCLALPCLVLISFPLCLSLLFLPYFLPYFFSFFFSHPPLVSHLSTSFLWLQENSLFTL